MNVSQNPNTSIIKPDPPYGCLKGGKKKTYRQYYGKQRHNKTLKHSSGQNNHKEVVPLVISSTIDDNEPKQRERPMSIEVKLLNFQLLQK